MKTYLVKATFKGEDGSLGYRKNYDYLLEVTEYNWWEAFWNGYKIVIRDRGERKKPWFRPKENAEGFCPYGSMKAFLNNWEVISSTNPKIRRKYKSSPLRRAK